jgi:hypothetical protein
MLQKSLTVLAVFIFANSAFAAVNGPTYCHPNGRCFVLALQQVTTWETAENYCEANLQRGRLASVRDTFDTSFIISWMTPSQVTSNVWTGGFRVGDLPFQWTDAYAFGYTNWAPNEPSGDGKCVQICYTTTAQCRIGQWRAVACGQQGQIICEYGNWSDVPITSPPPPPPSTTPVPTPAFAEKICNVVTGKCYTLFLGSLDWFSAELFCESQTNSATTATLASVLSAQDTATIASLAEFPFVNGNLWLGASAFGLQNWGWTDGSFWSYINWAPGQPNAGQGNCLQTLVCNTADPGCTQGLWGKNNCQQKQSFICENIKYP